MAKYPLADLFKKREVKEPVEEPPITALPSELASSLKGIDFTVPSPSLPAGYGQPATVKIMPDYEFIGTELKMRSEDYLIFYEGKQVGKVASDTGQLNMDDPGFWWKAWIPSFMERLQLSQTGQVPKEAFSGTPFEVQRQFSDWMSTPKKIGKLDIPAPATVLSAIGAVGAIGIAAYYGVQGLYQTTMAASLKRNLRSWAKSTGVKIPPETEALFIRQSIAQLPKKFMLKEAAKTLFKPTKTGYVLTPAGTQAVNQEALALVNKVAPTLVPTATQTGAMAFGGLPISATSWSAMANADKAALVKSVGLGEGIATKPFESLTPEELTKLGGVTPEVLTAPERIAMPIEVQREQIVRGQAELDMLPPGKVEPNSIVATRSGYIGTDAEGKAALVIQVTQEGSRLVAGNVVGRADVPKLTIGRLLKQAEPQLREANIQVPTEGLSEEGAAIAEKFLQPEIKPPVELTEQELLRTTPIGRLKPKEIADVGVRDTVNKIKGIDISGLPLEYKTEINEILKDFDIAFRTNKTLKKRSSLISYIKRLEADGIEVTVPQSYIDIAYKTQLADMTTEQVQMLHDMVQGLVKMGKLKNKLLRVQAGRRVDEAEKAIVEHLGVPPEAGVITKATFDESWSNRLLERYKGFIARTDRMERIVLALDGYEKNGLMWQTFYNPIDKATDQKLLGIQKTVDEFRAFLKENDIDLKKVISVKKEVVPGVKMTSSERIGVYLHSLNKDNMAHLVYGNKIDEKLIEAVINQMTPDEIAVAKYLGSYFRDAAPAVSKVRTEVEGKSLDVVENYFPIILESRAETTFMSQERKLIEDALQDFGKELSLEDSFRFTSKWASAKIAKQFIRKRSHRALQPVSLDALEIFIRRMEAMEHYKAFAPPVRDLQLILNRKDVQRAIVNKAGRATLQVMNQWLKDVAKTNALAVTSQAERTWRTLRVNAVTAVLGINLTTAMKQIPSMLIGAAEIGNIPAIKGMFTSLAHPKETRQMIKDLAPQIYRRSIERELAEAKLMRSLEKRLTDRLSAREAFMFLTVTADRIVVNGLWRGAFEDFLKKNPGQVNEAAASATGAIRRTQPFFSIKDLPEYWRSGEFSKALTMFTNQLNQYWNYFRHDTFGAAAAGKVGFGTVVKRVFEGFVLSAIVIGWITRSRPPEDAKDIVEDLSSMVFATLPIIGHFIVGGYQGFHSDSGLITTEVMSKLQEVSYYLAKEEWEKAALVIPELGGYLAGIPVAQPKRVIEALINIASGKSDDWLEVIWGSYRREEARKEDKEPVKVPGALPAPEGKYPLKDLFK